MIITTHSIAERSISYSISVCQSVRYTPIFCQNVFTGTAQLSSFWLYKVHQHIRKGSLLARALNETGAYVTEAIFDL